MAVAGYGALVHEREEGLGARRIEVDVCGLPCPVPRRHCQGVLETIVEQSGWAVVGRQVEEHGRREVGGEAEADLLVHAETAGEEAQDTLLVLERLFVVGQGRVARKMLAEVLDGLVEGAVSNIRIHPRRAWDVLVHQGVGVVDDLMDVEA